MSLQNKTVLVTGAARRIGAEIARVLHREGMNVMIHYHRSTGEAKQLAFELNSIRRGSAEIIQADLAQYTQAEIIVRKAIDRYGRLDVLINNASRFYKTPIGSIEETTWEDLINSNLKAPFFLAQAAFPHLRETKGCIINLGDIHSERPMRGYPIYSITKAGIIMLTKALAKEMAPDVRVNAVSPGETLWPEGESNAMTEEMKEAVLHRIALKRKGDPAEIAKAILFLIRDSDYMTGQTITVDGGRNLYM